MQITQTIDAPGHADTDANAFMLPTVGGYGGAIGYPPNNSDVVSATTTGYDGLAPGAPPAAPGSTIVYSTLTVLNGGAPNDQGTITFTGSGSTINGFLTVPSTATGTFTINVYEAYSSSPVFTASGLTPVNGVLNFSSFFNANSSVSLPTGTGLIIEVSQP